jgi:quercetin dioxygenase-like cupin family protein
MQWRRESPFEERTMDQPTFEAQLKRDGYDVMTNTTPGAKVNPEHSHPFDVKAMVLKGALTLHRDGQSQTYKSGETFAMAARLPAPRKLRRRRRGGAVRP